MGAAAGPTQVHIDFKPLMDIAAMLYGTSFVAERYSGIRPFLEVRPGRRVGQEGSQAGRLHCLGAVTVCMRLGQRGASTLAPFHALPCHHKRPRAAGLADACREGTSQWPHCLLLTCKWHLPFHQIACVAKASWCPVVQACLVLQGLTGCVCACAASAPRPAPAPSRSYACSVPAQAGPAAKALLAEGRPAREVQACAVSDERLLLVTRHIIAGAGASRQGGCRAFAVWLDALRLVYAA